MNLESRRRGTIYIEGLIAVTLVLSMLAMVAQLIFFASRQRNDIDQMRLATQEAANVLERLLVVPWDELNEQRIGRITVSAAGAERLQEPEIRISITDARDEFVAAKRLQVEVSWLDRGGQRVVPVQLTAWKHADARGEED